MIATKQVSGVGNDGGNWSFQLDTNGSDKIRWRSTQGAYAAIFTHTSTTSTYAKNQWYHATFVKQDNGTSQIYINGVLQATSTGTQHTPGTFPCWCKSAVQKAGGYIDELKGYNKPLMAMMQRLLLYSRCTGLTPAAPDNLTAIAASSSQVNVTWNAVNGVDNYTSSEYDNGTSWTTITGITGTTSSHTGRNPSTTYYRSLGNNQAGAELFQIGLMRQLLPQEQ